MSEQSEQRDTLKHVHPTHESVANIELTPAHPPREETPEYARAHHFLVHVKKAPCEVCGVTIDSVQAPDTVETHHFPIERSLAGACDPQRVHADFPQVYDAATLMAFVDSPANLKVLCSTHHRSTTAGIHHLLPQDFAILKYLRAGYVIAASRQDAAAAQAKDEAIAQQIQEGTTTDALSAPRRA